MSFWLNVPKRHLQHFLLNNCRIHILLISRWDILQQWPYVRPQNKPQQNFKYQNHTKYLLRPNRIKVEINSQRNFGNCVNTRKLNKMFLNNHWHIKNLRQKLKKKFLKQINNSIYQILWDTTKTVIRRKLIAIGIYIKKPERFQTNNAMIHVKQI